ncbi:hypothetical protein LSAT2_011528 [Lamellibrachia satsuma]|nr:hypothetical protein LSAT2_011528 [Lamellibrachia satsuma]
MWVGQQRQREELNIRLGGKEIMQVDGFVYLREIVTEDGHSEVEVRSRIQARANAWRKVEGVMSEIKSKKLKGKVVRACVAPACLYGLETVALTEQQQQKLSDSSSHPHRPSRCTNVVDAITPPRGTNTQVPNLTSSIRLRLAAAERDPRSSSKRNRSASTDRLSRRQRHILRLRDETRAPSSEAYASCRCRHIDDVRAGRHAL